MINYLKSRTEKNIAIVGHNSYFGQFKDNHIGYMENGDEELNIVDIVLLVNLILDNQFELIGDLNEDGTLNVIDVVLLLNLILYGEEELDPNAFGSSTSLDIITWNIEHFPKNQNTVDTLSVIIDPLPYLIDMGSPSTQ